MGTNTVNIMVNFENLIRLAMLVRDETVNKQNTALRVGGTLLELALALQEFLGTTDDHDARLLATNERTRHLKGITTNPDSLYELSALGIYGVWGGGWRGLLSVQFDAQNNVSQVALSSSTPSYSGSSVAWLSNKPCVMTRTYTNGAWTNWTTAQSAVIVSSGGSGDLEIQDENNHVLIRFENGHVRTKYFYSGDLDALFAAKQNTLVSGTNIKTINNQSLLGGGNISVSAGQLHLKILVIGNSYTADSFSYLPFILKNYGITIEVGMYVRGGGSLENQVDEWNTTSNTLYYINTKTQTAWQTLLGYGPKKAVQYKQWDIVTIQQGSVASVDYANYVPYARNLIELIRDVVSYPVTLAWNININRASSGSNYHAIANQILANIENACQREPINLIFPYGTAVFNARTNQTLAAIGGGGNLWASDQVHLQEGLPCYLAAITNVQALFDRFYPQYSVVGDTLGATITQSLINTWGVPSQNGSCTGISQANCRLAQIAAVLANRFKFNIKTLY